MAKRGEIEDGGARLGRLESRRLALFEDRYGLGSHERLLILLRRPCVSFAHIADKFRVTRERVRQWHALWLPGAPSGRERRRLCAVQRQQRRLLADGLFAAFVRDARAAGLRIEPVASASGYRSRLVTLEGRIVALRDARQTARGDAGADGTSYRLVGYRGRAEFVYVLLTSDAFLYIPVAELPLHGTTYVDRASGRFVTFRNSFAPVASGARVLNERQLTPPENTPALVEVKEC